MSFLSRLWPFKKKEKGDRAPEISRVARSEDETFIPGAGNDPDISARSDSPEGTVVRTPGKENGSKGHGSEATPSPSFKEAAPVFDSSGVRIYEPGQVIGEEFEVSESLEGGMGYVYLGRHLHYHMPMAVKQSKQGGEYLRRFKIEAEAWNRLGLHPHIAYCYWVKEIDDWPFIFIEYVEGGNLKDWISKGTCWELDTGLDMAIEICHGLKYVHDSGMLHRNVTPANILVDKTGTVKITDFGLVGTGGLGESGFSPEAASDATHTMPGIGTPAYMPPEQWTDAHNLGKEADIFSFGMCLWEMICGTRAYDSTVERSDPGSIDRLRPGLPEGLKSLLLGLVAWEAKDRPGDFRDVIEELNGVYRELYGEDAPSYRLPELDVAADNLNNQGVSYWELGQYDKARACFKKAIEKENAHPQANFNLGNFHVLDGLLQNPASRDAVLSMLRSVLRDSGFDEKEIEKRVERVERSGYFADGLGRLLKGHTGPVNSVTFSPDARYLASGGGFLDPTIRVWDAETGQELKVLKGRYRWPVTSVAFSPDGRYLASGIGKETILWDPKKGRALKVLKGHTGTVWSVVFSPNGRYLASWSDDDTVRVWNTKTGEEIRVLKRHSYYDTYFLFLKDYFVAFSPESQFLAASNLDGTIRLWNVETGEEVMKWYNRGFISVAFSPDGRFLVAWRGDDTVRVWNTKTGEEMRVLKGHTDDVTSVAFSPDGRYLASGSADETIRLWDVETGKEMRVLKGHTDDVTSVAFSPDGRYLASGNGDNTIRLWDVETGEEMRVLKGHTESTYSVAFSPDGRFLTSGLWALIIPHNWSDDDTIRLWDDILQLRCAFSPPRSFSALKEREMIKKTRKFLAELEEKALGGDPSGAVVEAVKGWQKDNYNLSSPFHSFLRRHWGQCNTDVSGLIFLGYLKGHTRWVYSVAFSPDGRYLASGSDDETIRLWDAETGKELRVLKGHTWSVNSVAFSPDGRYLASGSEDETIRLWDAETGKELRVLGGHTDDVNSVAFSPDGRYLASGSRDETIRLWDVETGKELRVLKGHIDWVFSIAFSPDGRLLAAGEGTSALGGTSDSTVLVWDVETGKQLMLLKWHTGAVNSVSVAFSPDGRLLAAGIGFPLAVAAQCNDNICLWDLETGKTLRMLKGHTWSVNSVAFSPNGRCLASGSRDETIRLWDAETGKELRVLGGHTDDVNSVAFSPDGRYLASGSRDGTIGLYCFLPKIEKS